MIKKIIKKWILFLCYLLVFFLLSGCWDYNDVEKRSIVVSIGVDRVGDYIEFSGEIAKLFTQTGEKKQETKAANVYTDLSYGKTFEEARVDFNSRRPYPTFLGATRVVVFGSNFAKEGIEPYLNRINKMYDYRKTILIAVSRERPAEIFDLDVEKDIAVGFLIEDNINFLANMGSTIYASVGNILSDVAIGNIGYVLPYIGIDQESIKYLGLAIMKDSKMIDTMNIKECRGLLFLLADNGTYTETLPGLENEKNKKSFRLNIIKRKITTEYIENQVVIQIKMDLKAQLQYQYFREPITEKEMSKMEHLIGEEVKCCIREVITKAQSEYQCDILEFAKYFRADHPKIYEEVDWSDKFTEAKVLIDVNVKIVNQNLSDPNAKKEI